MSADPGAEASEADASPPDDLGLGRPTNVPLAERADRIRRGAVGVISAAVIVIAAVAVGIGLLLVVGWLVAIGVPFVASSGL